MSGTLSFSIAAAIALAVLLGITRLIVRRVLASPTARGPAWRAAVLCALQLGAGAALFMMLFPAATRNSGGALVIATAGAPKAIALAPGERLIALPEARLARGVEQAPDLASALRRHPGETAIRVIGQGLAPRDREGLKGVTITFAPPLPPRGLVRIALPGPLAPGNAFIVAGEIGSLPVGMVELLDPAGGTIAQARIKAGEGFRLSATMRAPGLALFALRLRDESGRLIEHVDVPIDAAPRPAPRVLVLAGAPSAENKFLRRWALDAGIMLAQEIDAGGGVQLGDPATPLTSARLSQIDLVTIDDRRWESLGPTQRAALLSATEQGMGLLLRLTGPPSLAVRRDWAALGFALSNEAKAAPPARDAPSLPEPSRLLPLPSGPNLVPLNAGNAAWTPRGQGRIGLLTQDDTYVLALSGRGPGHGQIWSTLLSVLSRPEAAPLAWIDGSARAQSRVILCGLQTSASVHGQEARAAEVLLDPGAGQERCAGYWPASPGWHTLSSQGKELHFYVHPAAALDSLAAFEARAATLALAAATQSGAEANTAARVHASPLAWFAMLLLLLCALWWLERKRFGGAEHSNDAQMVAAGAFSAKV